MAMYQSHTPESFEANQNKCKDAIERIAGYIDRIHHLEIKLPHARSKLFQTEPRALEAVLAGSFQYRLKGSHIPSDRTTSR